jgi:hypothetical protein
MALVTALITRVRLSDICSNHLILQDQGSSAYNTYGKKAKASKIGIFTSIRIGAVKLKNQYH